MTGIVIRTSPIRRVEFVCPQCGVDRDGTIVDQQRWYVVARRPARAAGQARSGGRVPRLRAPVRASACSTVPTAAALGDMLERCDAARDRDDRPARRRARPRVEVERFAVEMMRNERLRVRPGRRSTLDLARAHRPGHRAPRAAARRRADRPRQAGPAAPPPRARHAHRRADHRPARRRSCGSAWRSAWRRRTSTVCSPPLASTTPRSPESARPGRGPQSATSRVVTVPRSPNDGDDLVAGGDRLHRAERTGHQHVAGPQRDARARTARRPATGPRATGCRGTPRRTRSRPRSPLMRHAHRHRADVERAQRHRPAADHVEAAARVVGDGVDDADLPVLDPAVDDLDRRQRELDGADDLGEAVRGVVRGRARARARPRPRRGAGSGATPGCRPRRRTRCRRTACRSRAGRRRSAAAPPST